MIGSLTMKKLYIIKGHHSYKVGITSQDISKRISGLQVGNPHPLECVYQEPRSNADNIESTIHSLLSDYQMNGEWFSSEIKPFVQLCKDHDVTEAIKQWTAPKDQSLTINPILSQHKQTLEHKMKTLRSESDRCSGCPPVYKASESP
jgi:hypothetical protein